MDGRYAHGVFVAKHDTLVTKCPLRGTHRPRRHKVNIWLVLGDLLALASVLLVARPFVREPAPEHAPAGRAGNALEQERIALEEERDRALAALKELEFDHRTGKVSDDDYRALVGPLRRRAAELLRALEPRKPRRRAHSCRPPLAARTAVRA